MSCAAPLGIGANAALFRTRSGVFVLEHLGRHEAGGDVHALGGHREAPPVVLDRDARDLGHEAHRLPRDAGHAEDGAAEDEADAVAEPQGAGHG
jgi:hypothetical protein